MTEKNSTLLFIIPGFFYIEDFQKLLYYNDIPLGTLQISSFLKERANVITNIIDLRLEGEMNNKLNVETSIKEDFKKDFIKVLERENIQEFQNIGINCYTSMNFFQTNMIADILKEEFPEINIIVGGYHPTAVPEDFTYEDSPFDFVIRGEAELALLDLFNSSIIQKSNSNRTKILFSKILIDINSLPFPDYELYLNKYPYKDKFKFEFYMSRGCPYQCAFCADNYKFRSFTFEKFKEQFKELIKIVQDYNSKNLKIGFADQTFNKVSISERVLDYIFDNKLQEDFTFSCQNRVEVISENPKIIDKLRKCRMTVGYGLEAVNKNLLKEMHKTENPIKYIENVKEIIKKYKNDNDFYCRLNVLVGFPGENQETFNETIDFINKHALHKNIQISPTLFSNYPNVFVYKNMKYYEKKYGTQFIRNWWKLELNAFKNAVPQKPSKIYSLKDMIRDYKDNYIKILKVFKRNTFTELVTWKRFFNKWYSEL